MSQSTGKYNKLDTYFYDYHVLAISVETSKIRLLSLKNERDTLKQLEWLTKDVQDEIKKLEKLIIVREKLIVEQETSLNEMKNLIESFPNQLKDTEYEVYRLSIIENKSLPEISEKLCFTPQYIRVIRFRILDKFANYRRITE